MAKNEPVMFCEVKMNIEFGRFLLIFSFLYFAMGGVMAPASELSQNNYGDLKEIDENSIEFKYLKVFFPDAKLVPCLEAKSISYKDCVKAKHFIAYNLWQLHSLVNVVPLASEIRDNNLKSFNLFTDKFRFDLLGSSGHNFSLAYRSEHKDFLKLKDNMSVCFNAECRSVISFSSHTHEEYAEIWSKLVEMYNCIEGSRKGDPYDFPGCVYAGRGVKRDFFLDCKSSEFPDEVYKIDEAIVSACPLF